MSALWLKDLAQKTHRGIEGRVRAGQSGGGLSFGYRVPRRFRPDGTIAAGDMEIIAEEPARTRIKISNPAQPRQDRLPPSFQEGCLSHPS